LRAHVNRVLNRIYGSKTEEIKGGWREIHNETRHKRYK
jgi:hypothetical protein